VTQAIAISPEEHLRRDMEQLAGKSLAFVYYAFDWGKPGPLEHETGPDEWQIKLLKAIDEGVLTPAEAIKLAVRSGHGIGKSALIAWIILWFMSTRPHPQIVVTANTKPQLKTKTWRELAVWHKRLINKHWFKMAGESFYHTKHPETWRANMIPWTEQNSEAFAGTHEKHVLIIFDEASAIPAIIWEVAEGAMSGKAHAGEPMTKMWVAFGNPTQNTGMFSACFKKLRHRWKTWEIDSRTAKMYDQNLAAELIEDYGEDSDIVRVRVKGQEPRAGMLQFIGLDIVEAAMQRRAHESTYSFAPKILGVDIAREGDDRTVLTYRQGIACLKQRKLRVNDAMRIGDIIKQESDEWGADGVILDMGNIGAAIYDYLIGKLNMDNVLGVWFGEKANNTKYFNKRAEMWGEMRDWIKQGGVLPEDNELRDDLTGPESVNRLDDGRIQLEKKADMKKRDLPSPDCGDSLAVTFAYSVEKRDPLEGTLAGMARGGGRDVYEYDFEV
jgi:hypothetical protein